MPHQVVMGALLKCTFGAAPAPLIVLPASRCLAEGRPCANIMDHKPFVNIPTFGMCKSMANPMVAAATAAAMGVLTQMPCIPMTVSPWLPGATKTLIANFPALHKNCKCLCTWGGMIKVDHPGTTKTKVA